MSERTYADILKGAWSEVPEPKVLPVGSWLLKGTNASVQAPRSEDKSAVALFVYVPQEPMNDVDGEELDNLGDNYDVSANRIFYRIYLETAADWDKVRKHMEKHGIDVSGGVETSFKAFRNAKIIGHLKQSVYTNAAGDVVQQNDADGFLPVE